MFFGARNRASRCSLSGVLIHPPAQAALEFCHVEKSGFKDAIRRTGRCNTCEDTCCACTHSGHDGTAGITDDTEDCTEDTDRSPAALPPRRTSPDDELGDGTPRGRRREKLTEAAPTGTLVARGVLTAHGVDPLHPFSSGSYPYPLQLVLARCGSVISVGPPRRKVLYRPIETTLGFAALASKKPW